MTKSSTPKLAAGKARTAALNKATKSAVGIGRTANSQKSSKAVAETTNPKIALEENAVKTATNSKVTSKRAPRMARTKHSRTEAALKARDSVPVPAHKTAAGTARIKDAEIASKTNVVVPRTAGLAGTVRTTEVLRSGKNAVGVARDPDPKIASKAAANKARDPKPKILSTAPAGTARTSDPKPAPQAGVSDIAPAPKAAAGTARTTEAMGAPKAAAEMTNIMALRNAPKEGTEIARVKDPLAAAKADTGTPRTTKPTPPPKAAAGMAHHAAKTAAPFDDFALDSPVHRALRALSEKALAQMRQLFERSNNTLKSALESCEKLFGPAGQEAVTFNRKIIEIAAHNIDAGFDLATNLARAKNLAEVIEFQTAYWRKQMGDLSPEAEDKR
jgi:hypothetical protein